MKRVPPDHFTTFWENKMVIAQIQPRFMKQKDAPDFFGVSRGSFDKYIRPSLTAIRWGDTAQSGISYNVLEMDALADKILERNGRPGMKGESIWDEQKESRDCISSSGKDPNSGKYKAQSSTSASEKVQEQITKMRQK